MRQMESTGKVQTVLGVIDADSLGKTLCHEHLLFGLSAWVPILNRLSTACPSVDSSRMLAIAPET